MRGKIEVVDRKPIPIVKSVKQISKLINQSAATPAPRMVLQDYSKTLNYERYYGIDRPESPTG